MRKMNKNIAREKFYSYFFYIFTIRITIRIYIQPINVSIKYSVFCNNYF